VEIAAALSMTGSFEAFGKGNLEGIQLALEEAKASGDGPQPSPAGEPLIP